MRVGVISYSTDMAQEYPSLLEVHIYQHKSCVSLSAIIEERGIGFTLRITPSTLPNVDRSSQTQGRIPGRALSSSHRRTLGSPSRNLNRFSQSVLCEYHCRRKSGTGRQRIASHVH